MAEGWCSLCKSPFLASINKLIRDDKNAGEAARAMAVFDVKFDRHTYYKHKEHVNNGAEKMQTMVEKARARELEGEKPKTSRGVLEKIMNLGMENIIENPEIITPDHTLKAAAELQKADNKQEPFLVALAKVAMIAPPPEVQGYLDGGTDQDEMFVGEYLQLGTSQDEEEEFVYGTRQDS